MKYLFQSVLDMDFGVEQHTNDEKLIDILYTHQSCGAHSGRQYHNWNHVKDMIKLAIERDACKSIELLYAIMGHDLVYDTNETNDANVDLSVENTMAYIKQFHLDKLIDCGWVGNLINVTKNPIRVIRDSSGCHEEHEILHDLDFAYFRDIDIHRTTVSKIRQEWNVSDAMFMSTRLKWLLNATTECCTYNNKSPYVSDRVFTQEEGLAAYDNMNTELNMYIDGIKFWEEI